MTEPTSATRAVRAGVTIDPAHRAVVPPLYLSSTYAFDSLADRGEYDYSRSGNPTRTMLADVLAGLEGGFGAVVTASGMAAATTVLNALMPAGGRLVAPFDCYGGTWRLLDALARRGGFDLDLVDLSDLAAAETAITSGTSLVWVESPSNPLLRITDIAAVAGLAHRVGALVVADNTFLSPMVQRPLALGADVVLHSTTKYINGHSDVVGGVVVAAQEQHHNELAWWANCLGVTGGAFDSYLTLRGLRTLHLRVAAAQANAAALVELLVDHPAVHAVHYPGLPDHPGHDLAARQQDGFGAMVTFELADEAAVTRFVDGLDHFCLAESLGGVESLVSHTASMTHAAMSPEARAAAGITDGMLRLSVGVEDVHDLLADLKSGLDRAGS
ncbi:MAG: cystathionine gamma-synthase [Propionicimonas sp.]|uniref:cystathionine gamma-synthase n=1 Tax=Propionicimonas sp. TaxID=1955623 RepID=UPI002B1F1358|nr:cystathionine gamma-synthase [Propionicimonas sp.]MEA4944742.1 cystathionine gamma-synthase [Propionicimonas sp.]